MWSMHMAAGNIPVDWYGAASEAEEYRPLGKPHTASYGERTAAAPPQWGPSTAVTIGTVGKSWFYNFIG